MALGQRVSFSCIQFSLKSENSSVGNPLSEDSIQCVLGGDQYNVQKSGQEMGSRTGCLFCTANLQCLNRRNCWDSLAKLFCRLSLGIIQLPPANFFLFFPNDLQSSKVCVFRASECWRSGSGEVELVCKATLKHTTVWKDRMKSMKWILRNARWVKAATPWHQDFIRNISDTMVPLIVNLIRCLSLQCFPVNHYISFMYM